MGSALISAAEDVTDCRLATAWCRGRRRAAFGVRRAVERRDRPTQLTDRDAAAKMHITIRSLSEIGAGRSSLRTPDASTWRTRVGAGTDGRGRRRTNAA